MRVTTKIRLAERFCVVTRGGNGYIGQNRGELLPEYGLQRAFSVVTRHKSTPLRLSPEAVTDSCGCFAHRPKQARDFEESPDVNQQTVDIPRQGGQGRRRTGDIPRQAGLGRRRTATPQGRSDRDGGARRHPKADGCRLADSAPASGRGGADGGVVHRLAHRRRQIEAAFVGGGQTGTHLEGGRTAEVEVGIHTVVAHIPVEL